MTNSSLLKMAIEFVDLAINNGDFPVRYVGLPEGNQSLNIGVPYFSHNPSYAIPTNQWLRRYFLDRFPYIALA